MQFLLWLRSTDLQLNMEANKLESVDKLITVAILLLEVTRTYGRLTMGNYDPLLVCVQKDRELGHVTHVPRKISIHCKVTVVGDIRDTFTFKKNFRGTKEDDNWVAKTD